MTVPTAQNQISSNIFKTWLIMLLFSFFVVGIVYIFARGFGYDTPSALALTGIAFIITGIMNFISYYFSDQIVLTMSGAQPVSVQSNREIYHLVENLAIADGIPTPKIYIINDSSPNAFATGRDPKHATIVYTRGILDKLNRQELEGVTAHELSHVRNRDTLMLTVVSILVGLIALLADFFMRSLWFRGGRDEEREGNAGAIFFIIAFVAAILAPIIGTLIQLAVSRQREYLADASGAYLTRNPEALAQALINISGDKEPLEAANRATAHLYIVNPLRGRNAAGWLAGLFNTHPPISDRVKRLREMEGMA